MKKKIILSSLIVFVLIFVLINPKTYIYSISNALSLFTFKYLPGAFIFFFFSKLLISLDFQSILGSIFKRPFRYLYNTSETSCFVFTLSLLCGNPLPTKLAADFYSKGYMSKNEAITSCIISSITGPIFVIGTIGALFFKNEIYGYILYLSQIFSALINGFIYKKPYDENKSTIILKEKFSLSSIMLDTIQTLLIICGFICISYLLSDVLINLKILDLIFKLLPIDKTFIEGIFLSLIEITRGSEVLSYCQVDIKIVLPILAGLISFSGISILLQSIAFLENAKLPILRFILSKFTQALISAIICFLLLILIC